VARANFPPFPPYFPPYHKNLSTKSEIKIKEYVCQVSSKSLKNCDLQTGTDRHPDIQTDRQTSDERKNSLSRRIGDFARSVNYTIEIITQLCQSDVIIKIINSEFLYFFEGPTKSGFQNKCLFLFKFSIHVCLVWMGVQNVLKVGFN